jgi:hypothetical protein
MGLVGELVGLDLGERVERTDAAFSAQIVVWCETPDASASIDDCAILPSSYFVSDQAGIEADNNQGSTSRSREGRPRRERRPTTRYTGDEWVR